MRLTTKNITPYLVDKGFLSTTDLMNGDFVMNQSQSRNCIFHISLSTDSGLFVKQLVAMDALNIYLMQKDATTHHLFHHTAMYESLRAYIPAYYGYDVNQQVLVTENFTNAVNLLESYMASNQLSTTDAVEVANILAHLHQDISEELPQNSSLQFYNRDVPWILRSHDLSFDKEVVFKLIQQDDIITSALYQLYQEWEGNTLMHGDIKFVNFLKIGSGNEAHIKLIDWETTNIGDPLWDVAGFFQSYLSFWAMNQAELKKTNPHVNPILWSLENCQVCMKAFWQQYVNKQNWSAEVAQQKLIKATKFTAARLLQTAKEANFSNPTQLQEHVVKTVQLAQNIFKSPIQAAADLMGINSAS